MKESEDHVLTRRLVIAVWYTFWITLAGFILWIILIFKTVGAST